MRILYLNPFSQEVSGPDESLRAMLRVLVPGGVEAHVVLPAPGPQVERYETIGATVHFAPLAVLRRDLSFDAATFPLRLARSTAAVRRIAKGVGADIIHTNMEVLLEGGLAARSLGIPHVFHYRGNTLDRPKWVFDLLAAVWSANADRIYCISQATAQVFQKRGRGAKVEVLYNGIDPAAFANAVRSDDVRRSLGAEPRDRLIGTVGRLHPRKDIETFLRALAAVAGARPEVRGVVVGVAEAPVELEYRQSLDALVQELGLDGRVTFAGARRDIPAVMAALDVFVLSSRHEGFGRVVAEAMAAARPMVVTDEGALPELVASGRYGLVARPGDAADFAAKVTQLVAEPREAAAMAARALERARDFDAATAGVRVRACYEQLTRGSASTVPAP
jgi:glycosyltransferase involved in cell wall biosynthesis